jgi:hypothetical protein
MVLSEEELPGTGWEVTKKDDFTKSPTPDIQACKDSSQKVDALSASIEKNRAGRAKVELTKASSTGPDLQVESEVELYKSNNDLDGFVDKVKPLVTGSAYGACLEAAIQDGLPGAKVKKVDPSSAVPTGGVAVAFLVDIPSLKASIKFEFYGWTDKNAAVTVTFSGDPAEVNAGLTDAAINSTQMSMAIVAALTN